MPLARHAIVRAGAAQGYALIDGDVVTDLRRLADDDEAVVDEEVASDLGTGVNIDRGQEAGEVIDQPREEEGSRLIQPMRDPVPGQRPDAGVQQNLRTRMRSGIASPDRIEISGQSARHEHVPRCDTRI